MIYLVFTRKQCKMEKSQREPSLKLVSDFPLVSSPKKREKRLDCRNSVEKYSDSFLPRNQFSPTRCPDLCDRNVLPPGQFVPLCNLCKRKMSLCTSEHQYISRYIYSQTKPLRFVL